MACAASLRSTLRTPARAPLQFLLKQNARANYHSHEHPPPLPYGDAETAILSAALRHVPSHGFTNKALSLGAIDVGYLDVSLSLFRRGPFELVLYHLVSQRLGLKSRVQFPNEVMGVGSRVRSLVLERLRGNVDAGTVPRWQEALGMMSLAENIPASLQELGALSDEIWFIAGDTSVDTSWYTKRASLSGIYAATEIYQTTDQSTDFRDTEQFLDRRLEELRVAGSSAANITQWMGFQGGALFSLLRSKGVRI